MRHKVRVRSNGLIMNKRIVAFLLILTLIMTGCGQGSSEESFKEPQQELAAWQQISQQEAQRIMDEEEGFVILDVRTQEEYDEGHIPGAICVPNEAIIDTPPEELPDKDQLILVYCRSGRRSKEASQKLADMGYRDIREFGGINTWPGEIVTGETASNESQGTEDMQENSSEQSIKLTVAGRELDVTWSENSTVEALEELLKKGDITLEMSDYAGFEKGAPFPEELPQNNEPMNTDAGDIILYQGRQFVIYYDTNSWSLTPLGKVQGISKDDLKSLLGTGNIAAVLSLSGDGK